MKDQKEPNIIEVLLFCRENKLPARVVGKWVWLKFSAKPKSYILDSLKNIGFRWSKRRRQWAHNCGNPSQPAKNYAPWEKYETKTIDEAFPSNR